jgi:hypothetical protein
MLAYLSKIKNWELYKAVNLGCTLHEMRCDNIVEIFFSWCKEARTYCTPYYFLKYLLLQNIERINDLHESSLAEGDCGVNKRYLLNIIIIIIIC